VCFSESGASNRVAEDQRSKKVFRVVQAGIGNPSIWDDLAAQSLLGVEGFAERLRQLMTEKQQIREIPKGQRFVGRPSLEKLFSHNPGKASGTGSSPKLLHPTVIARWRWQASWAYIIRRSAESSHPTETRISRPCYTAALAGVGEGVNRTHRKSCVKFTARVLFI
jgi:hypothetical protein